MECDSAEVCIVGGGLVGLSLAVALGSVGVDTLLLDARPPEADLAPDFDGRASALARGSTRLYEALDLWSACLAGAAPIRDIRVSDGRPGLPASPFFLHYAMSDLGEDDADASPPAMGYIVENRFLRHALLSRVREMPSVRVLAPALVAAQDVEAGLARLSLEAGGEVRARLVVAAEGQRSRLREQAGIAVRRWDYPQVGIVSTLAHEAPHEGTAFECFLPDGPFAILPLTDEPEGGRHRSSLVWTARADMRETIMGLDAEAFAAACQRRFGQSLGRFEEAGGRFAYPLRFLLASRFHAPRLALIGETGHAMHPIAGQGLNLGLRDVAALAELVVDACRLGLDPGDPDLLERYTRWRRFDSTTLCLVTDGLNRLFSNDLPPVRLARDVGLAAVNRMGPAKRFFMQHAMGLTGRLPRLIEGRAL